MPFVTTTVLAVTAIAMAVAAAGTSAYSAEQQGKAEQSMADYNATIEKQNAMVAARDANVQANQMREQNRTIMAKIHAAQGASGTASDVGSPLLIQANDAAKLELGALEAERQGGIESAKHTQQSVLDTMSGQASRQAGKLNAIAYGLKGVSSAASMGAGSFGGNGGGSLMTG